MIFGAIYDSAGSPIRDAIIRIAPPGDTARFGRSAGAARSDSAGTFFIPDVRPNVYHLTAQRLGFCRISDSAAVAAANVGPIIIRLPHANIRLGPVGF